MDMKFSDKLKYKASFWALTLPVLPYFVAFLIIATLNPFWFRESLLRFLQRQVQRYNDYRQKLLKPQLDKYKMFDILKQNSGRAKSSDTVGSKTP